MSWSRRTWKIAWRMWSNGSTKLAIAQMLRSLLLTSSTNWSHPRTKSLELSSSSMKRFNSKQWKRRLLMILASIISKKNLHPTTVRWISISEKKSERILTGESTTIFLWLILSQEALISSKLLALSIAISLWTLKLGEERTIHPLNWIKSMFRLTSTE